MVRRAKGAKDCLLGSVLACLYLPYVFSVGIDASEDFEFDNPPLKNSLLKVLV